MAALERQTLDVGADGLGDPQAVQAQQRHEGVVPGSGQARGHQERTHLFSVQSHRVGLVVQTGLADVDRGRVLDDALLDRVAVEAGDGAQPTRDGGSRPSSDLQVPGERFDVGRRAQNSARWCSAHQVAN